MISENLQYLRKKFHFSQEEVAERIGVSRQAVAKWESGLHIVKEPAPKPTLTIITIRLSQGSGLSLREPSVLTA